jgi:hypothetical protein
VRRHLVAGAALASTLFAYPREAQASGGVEIAAVVVTIVLADLAFTIGNTVYVARNERPDKAWATAGAIVGGPQALVLSIGVPIITTSINDPAGTSLLVGLSSIPTFMTIYGAWGASTDTADPGALYGVSWATAGNGMFTLVDIANATNGKLGGRSLGVFEMVATAPQIAVASAQLAKPDLGSKAGWIALDAWAGVLFVHGVAATIVGGPGEELPPIPPEPPPPPPPNPIVPEPAPMPPGPFVPDDQDPGRAVPPPPPPPPPHGRARPLRRDAVVPGSLSVAPLTLPGGMGLSLRGALF